MKLYRAERKLRTYLAVNKITKLEFAKMCGVSVQSIKNWCDTGGVPVKNMKHQYAVILVEKTNGYITMRDCGY